MGELCRQLEDIANILAFIQFFVADNHFRPTLQTATLFTFTVELFPVLNNVDFISADIQKYGMFL